ncbi:NAC domain-containing protein 19 [Nymphaea thermarum]|nr:NAC domain-containing protein 19 [Nymphaea thermarum]
MGDKISLPPGFKFFPTDKDLILHYLYKKVKLLPCQSDFITEIDLYNYNPWELPGKALGGGKEWYFYSQRPNNYKKNSIQYRPAASGHWRVTAMDEPVSNGNTVVGCKRSLVFYTGKAPSGTKTDWIMDEYSLLESTTRTCKKRVSGDWVLCRIQERGLDSELNCGDDDDDDGRELSYLDEIFFSLDNLDEISSPSDFTATLFH